VEIRDNHEFVQSGPFRFVRHPAYFSMILELLALALICNAFFTLLLIPIFFVPVLIMRIRIEEVALVEKFGDAYRTFQRTKPALIPWKW
jgi:protein-S-isoprenylcysteine O-methyltransferase Ste14